MVRPSCSSNGICNRIDLADFEMSHEAVSDRGLKPVYGVGIAEVTH